MKNPETIALHQINQKLKNGEIFGKDVFSWPNGNGPRFPYFHAVLSYGKDYNGENIFRWTHYGSSANRATLKDLKWIITVIFKTTPSRFLQEYITKSGSRIDYISRSA